MKRTTKLGKAKRIIYIYIYILGKAKYIIYILSKAKHILICFVSLGLVFFFVFIIQIIITIILHVLH